MKIFSLFLVTIFLSNMESNAQHFDAKQKNPFGLTSINTSASKPVFADLDNDGDWDMMSGVGSSGSGQFWYFENIGTASSPSFAPKQQNPFGLTSINTSETKPAFADLDNDGDWDMMSGVGSSGSGQFWYFENIGTASSPSFAAKQQNPFGLTSLNTSATKPAFTDLDNDGDWDMISGGGNTGGGNFWYFMNIGTATSPSFAPKQQNPFGITSLPTSATNPAFADLDNDGDWDMISGGGNTGGGNFWYFKNIGTASSPSFAPKQQNPFGLTPLTTSETNPTFVDLDNDGDWDMMSGVGASGDGEFWYFKNSSSTSTFEIFKSKPSVIIYPNPTNGLVNIQHLEGEKIQISLSMVDGRQVQSNNIRGNDIDRIDFTAQPAGLYLIKVGYVGGIVTEKIIKY